MKFTVLKDLLQEKLSTASRFTLSKMSSVPLLQGGLLSFNENLLTITTTNLNEFFQTKIKITANIEKKLIVDIKKIVEFLALLPSGKVDIGIEDTSLTIQSNKTKAVFSYISSQDFPQPPKIEGQTQALKKKFFQESLSLVIFSAATDEARPILTGINFHPLEGNLYVVATDGFRLSLVVEKQSQEFPYPLVVSSHVLEELTRLTNSNDHVDMTVSEVEKMIMFDCGDITLYSRVIEGDFPPFQKVIPQTHKTKITLEKEEFLRNIKLVAVFARDLSNIIILHLKKDGLYIKPRGGDSDTVVYQSTSFEGEEQTIAFNYKFILDFLNNISFKKVIFEMSEKNSPGLFRSDENDSFFHVIMPVRTEEE